MKNLSTMDSLPWYKHRWPWLLMAGPAIVVVAGFITAFLAVRSADGLVADDYYKQGLAVNQVKTRDDQALQSGLSGEMSHNGQQVQLYLKGHGDALPERVVLRLIHPTRNGEDQRIELAQEGAGFYRGQLQREPLGRFNVLIEDLAATWRLTGVWQADNVGAVILGVGAPQAPANNTH